MKRILVVVQLIFSALNICFAHNIFPSVGDKHDCNMDRGESTCIVDQYVGSQVIYEDEKVRVWNFTLAPGEMTSMHRHDYDYHFVAIQPTQLQVWGENGSVLYDFRAEGTIGFQIEGDYLIPTSPDIKLPNAVPRIHAAKNIGPNTYYEILFESKMHSVGLSINEEL